MRWIIRTVAVLSVMSWIVVAGLFARPVASPENHVLPLRGGLATVQDLPLDWSRRVLDGSRDVFPGACRSQAESVVPIVERHARRFHLDPLMVLAVIQVESRF